MTQLVHPAVRHDQATDQYFVNGAECCHEMYNAELQRILAYTEEQRRQKDLAAKQAAHIERLQGMRNNAFEVMYGYAPSMLSSAIPQLGQQVTQALSVLERANVTKASAPAKPFKLSLKTSPLFGYQRWRFDSPLKPLHDCLIRWVWNLQRQRARST